MRKRFKLEDLDCAHCAGLMEDAINKLDGVQSAKINFLALKMTIEADEERFDDIMQEVVKVCHRIEPDCTIVL